LFSMLASRLGTFEGLRVADLFAGTGALGLEALSRGAAHCTFVEKDRQAVEALKHNVERVGAGDRAEVRAQDAASFAGGPFHLVLLDPPYGSELGAKAIKRLVETGSIAPGGLVTVESALRDAIEAPGLALETERNYGKAKVTILRAPPAP
jgi:16S rRNA (guanine966-N2)-methyltransferase